MSLIPIQIVELGAICSALIEAGTALFPLKIVQIRILFKLSELGFDPESTDGLKVEDLAVHMAAERSSVSRQLSSMLKKGVVDIAPPKRRTSGYRLTPAGLQELEILKVAVSRVERMIRIGLLTKDGDLLGARLGKILEMIPREYTEDSLALIKLSEGKRTRSKLKSTNRRTWSGDLNRN